MPSFSGVYIGHQYWPIQFSFILAENLLICCHFRGNFRHFLSFPVIFWENVPGIPDARIKLFLRSDLCLCPKIIQQWV